MAKNAKPRKKYRPKPVYVNPLDFVLESVKPLAEHGNYLLEWKLRNHLAFEALMKANASKRDLDNLIAARNICEALVHTLDGKDIDGTLTRSAVALIEIHQRASEGKGTAMRAAEIQAMRDMMQFHDELLDVVSVRQFETALNYARREIKAGRAQAMARLQSEQEKTC